MKLAEEKLKELLVPPGFVAPEEFEKSTKRAKELKKTLEDVLVDGGIISDEQLGRVVAEGLGYSFVLIGDRAIEDNVLRIIPELVAKKQYAIAFERTKEGLKVGTADPENFEFFSWLEKKTGEKVIPYYATVHDIGNNLRRYHKELKEEFLTIFNSFLKEAKEGSGKDRVEPPISKMVDLLIQYAYENRASDIHIEPRGKDVHIRYRIDGILHDVLTYPKTLHGQIISRIKILSKLRTDEHLSAQDGKFQATFGGEAFDIRVSIIPITRGENAVLRLLSESFQKFSLEDLGMRGADLVKVNAAAKKPFGMILATGPTGSGKTTTLYGILKILNTPEVNIATIEDPVEYDIEGVNQVQVNSKTNLTFAKGLRSIVRQDPNIIMVGEIRDEETAGIAINSAMTGHLVLSTLHTINAATSLPRLLDMNIEPFLVASSINIIVAQRLVRKICTQCIESYTITPQERELLEEDAVARDLFSKVTGSADFSKILLYRGKGCKACGLIGFVGRTGIFEVLEIGERVKELIMEKADAGTIDAAAKGLGMTSMFYDGMEKVLGGVTTLEEVLRVMRA